jgi:hypothetical protein
MSQQLLKIIIKQTLLTEAAIDIWKAKNRSLSNEQLSQAEKYFTSLTGKYIASLHPTAKDLASLSFEQLETLYKTVEASKSKNLKSEYIQWITGQLKQLPDLSLQQVIEDYIPPLLSLQKNKEKFDPKFLENLQSIEELNKSLNQKASSMDLAATVPEAHLGKLAEENGWALYMPHTTEASCEIGKTGGRRDTTWCTTRPDASNMFLQYSASADENTILFYVVKKGINAETDPFAKMSVGFIDGNPNFSQGDGGVSVNADNKNLTQEKFEQILGEDLANKFLQIMQEKTGSLKGEHPAKDEFRKLVQNPKAFQAKIDSFAKDENGQELRKDFIHAALGYKEISPEILTVLEKDSDVSVRSKVADVSVRENVASNPNASPEILSVLAKDPVVSVRKKVASNPNASPEILSVLAKDSDSDVNKKAIDSLIKIARNPNASPEILSILAKDSKSHVRKNVASNPNASPEISSILAKDSYVSVREKVASNPNTPPDILTFLAKDSESSVREKVARNPNTSLKILTFLAKDSEGFGREAVASNPNTPPEILTFLAKDSNGFVRDAVARNPNTPPEIQNLLLKDSERYVREKIRNSLEKLKAEDLLESMIIEKMFNKLIRFI